MRRGLRQNPKVIAMARFLADDPKFREWLSENGGVTRHESVTVALVTRVTVASLLDVWSSLNESVGNDWEMPFMVLLDIDEIAEIPGLGRAMKLVGWVEEMQAGGLMFPNFGEHNTPAKERGGDAKSDAQRAREYRERKRQEKERHGVTSRHAIEEKRREEKSISSIEDISPLPPEGDGEDKPKRKSTEWIPTPDQVRVGSWFNRRSTTAWSDKERKAWAAITIDAADIDILEIYYLAEIPRKENYRRRDLLTLLHNWTGEIDRARRFAAEIKPDKIEF